MKKISDVNELRLIQMDILSYVDKICRENDIKYSISGGTLIGAIRHGGYIPWDDDIDIMLAREEYEKLIVEMSQIKYSDSPYQILTHDIDNDFKFPYAKVVDSRTIMHEDVVGCKDYGIYIDIFPIDYIPGDDKKCDDLFSSMRRLYNMLMMKRLKLSSRRSLLKNIVVAISQIVLLPISTDWLISTMEYKAKNAAGENKERRCCLVWGYGRKEIVPNSVHEAHIDLPFEDRKYMAVADYHSYLTRLFGDYMQLPPEEKRMTHHVFEAWWK